MAGWRQAVELAMTDDEIEELTAIAHSRTEAARRVERAQMLLAYRETASFFAVGQKVSVHHGAVIAVDAHDALRYSASQRHSWRHTHRADREADHSNG